MCCRFCANAGLASSATIPRADNATFVLSKFILFLHIGSPKRLSTRDSASHKDGSVTFESRFFQLQIIPSKGIFGNARIFGVELVNRTSFPRHLVGQGGSYERLKLLT